MSNTQTGVPKDLVKINLTHSILTIQIPEVWFSKHDPIVKVKNQLERRFGTTAGAMTLVLKDMNGQNVCTMGDDNATLNFYGIEHDHIIHCIDEDPNSIVKGLEDFSNVEKYVMSDADYNKLPMNVKKFKKELIKNKPEQLKEKSINKTTVIDSEYQKDIADNIKKGDRCELVEGKHRGVIAFIGKVPDLEEGYFVGVKLDEPCGNSDGNINGDQYFQCLPKYGVFLRPSEVNIGDFPEMDIDEI